MAIVGKRRREEKRERQKTRKGGSLIAAVTTYATVCLRLIQEGVEQNAGNELSIGDA